MSLYPLRCSICPRKEDFSDVSHLLTHVGSKGHLAQYQKLQVRSLKDIVASVQKTNYDQWYARNKLQALLSDRLEMKEAKAFKRARKESVGLESKRANCFQRGGAIESSPSRNVTRNRAKNRAKRAKPRKADFDENENGGDCSPVRGTRRSERITSYLITPVKRTPLPSSPPPPSTGDEEEVEEVEEIDPTLVTPKNYSKLKGIVYPGMALFDAATPEEARRRNQKKDGSVVKNLESRSKLVEPTETVYGMGWDMKKQRHIDDLEDDLSLIEGETPIAKPKPKARSKRKALARVPANIPRLVRHKVRTRVRSPRRVNASHDVHNIVRTASSSAQHLQAPYSPTEEENAEFQIAVSNMPLQKRTGNFTIFTDATTAYAPKLSYPSQHMPVGHTYAVPMSQRLVFPPPGPPWLQPQNQNQNPLCMSTNLTYRSMQPTYPDYQDIGKENIPPMSTMTEVNPLSWRSTVAGGSAESASSESSFGSYNGYSGYFGNPSSLVDPFGFQRNPLADAVEHFASTQSISAPTDSAMDGRATSEVSTQDGGATASTDSE